MGEAVEEKEGEERVEVREAEGREGGMEVEREGEGMVEGTEAEGKEAEGREVGVKAVEGREAV